MRARALRSRDLARTVDALGARDQTRQLGAALTEAAARDDISGVAEGAPAAWRAGFLWAVGRADPPVTLHARLFGEVLECLADMDQGAEGPDIADVSQQSVDAAVDVVAVLRGERPPSTVTGSPATAREPMGPENRVWAALMVRGVATALPVVRSQIEDEDAGREPPESPILHNRYLIRSLADELEPRIGAERAAALRAGTEEAAASPEASERGDGSGGELSPAAADAWRGMYDDEEPYEPSQFRTRRSAVRPVGGGGESDDEGGAAAAALSDEGPPLSEDEDEEDVYTERVAAVVRGAGLAGAGVRPLPVPRGPRV